MRAGGRRVWRALAPPPRASDSRAGKNNATYASKWRRRARCRECRWTGLFSDFSLPDFSGSPISLSDYRGRKNVLLVFNRGFG